MTETPTGTPTGTLVLVTDEMVESDPDTATPGCDGCCTEENGW